MSIFDDRVTEKFLKSLKFWSDGWGSPSYRASHNTKMWTLIKEHPDTLGYERRWCICYFPPTFEGMVYPGTCYPVDVRGRLMVSIDAAHEPHYISSIVDDQFYFNAFIEQALNGKVTAFNPLKYELPLLKNE
jgi:hypothetical protein